MAIIFWFCIYLCELQYKKGIPTLSILVIGGTYVSVINIPRMIYKSYKKQLKLIPALKRPVAYGLALLIVAVRTDFTSRWPLDSCL